MDARTATTAQGITFLDVRSPGEWDEGHIAGSIHVPLDELPLRLDDLPRDESLVVVCRSGARSALAAEFLGARGFDAENLEGGLLEWRAAGGRVDGRIA